MPVFLPMQYREVAAIVISKEKVAMNIFRLVRQSLKETLNQHLTSQKVSAGTQISLTGVRLMFLDPQCVEYSGLY